MALFSSGLYIKNMEIIETYFKEESQTDLQKDIIDVSELTFSGYEPYY